MSSRKFRGKEKDICHVYLLIGNLYWCNNNVMAKINIGTLMLFFWGIGIECYKFRCCGQAYRTHPVIKNKLK
jgi:hypothetical protein